MLLKDRVCFCLAAFVAAGPVSAQVVPLRTLGMKRIWDYSDAVSARAVQISQSGREADGLHQGNPVWILAGYADVAARLGITKGQQKLIMDERFRAQKEWARGYQSVAKADVATRRAKAKELNAKRRASQLAVVVKVLSANQLTRLYELKRQAAILSNGPNALRRKDFAALKLSPSQERRLVVRLTSSNRGGLFVDNWYSKADFRALQEVRRALVNYERRTLDAVLTDKQQADLKRLLGTPFDSRKNNTALGAKQDPMAEKELKQQFHHFHVARDLKSAGRGSHQRAVVGAGPNRSGLPIVRVQLMSLEPVWKDIGLNSTQRDAVLALRQDHHQRCKDLSAKAGRMKFKDWAPMLTKWENADRKKIATFLSALQLARLEQIRAQVVLQNEGLVGLRDKAFTVLKVSGAQHNEIAERIAKEKKPVTDRFREATWAGSMGRIFEILNDRQRQTLKRLLGRLVVQPLVT